MPLQLILGQSSVEIVHEKTLEGHNHSVWCVDLSSNHVVTASADKDLRVWDRTVDLMGVNSSVVGTPLSGHRNGENAMDGYTLRC